MTFEFAYFAKEFFIEELTPPKLQNLHFIPTFVDHETADGDSLIHIENTPYYANLIGERNKKKAEHLYNTSLVYVNYEDFVEYLKINKFEKITPELLLLIHLIYIAKNKALYYMQTTLTFDKSMYIPKDFL